VDGRSDNATSVDVEIDPHCHRLGRSQTDFALQAMHAMEVVALIWPEYLPAPQLSQTADPAASLYLPGAQSMHALPPFGPA